MTFARRASVLLAASGLVLAGCSALDRSASPAPTVTVTPTVTTVSTTSPPTSSASTSTASSSPATVTTTATVSATASDDRPTGVGEYADAFVRAWGLGDRTGASDYATALTVTNLFAIDGRGGSNWVRRESTQQGSRTQVRYTDGTGTTLYVLVDRATAASGATDAVVGANLEWEDSTSDWTFDDGNTSDSSAVTGLPSTVNTYADAFVRAWGVDDPSMDSYATDSVVTTLYADYGSGGSRWSRSSSTASSATYTNTDGSVLVLDVDATTVSAGRGDGITGADIS